MEDATPIFALKEESTNIRKQPLDVMSYSDVLRNMESKQQQQTPAVSVAVKPNIPPSPVYSYPTSPQILDQPSPAEPAPLENKMKQFQNEMIVLLVSYIVIHMSTVQEWIRSKIPNIVRAENGTMSVLGLVTNGVLLIVLWNVAKKLILKYMQE
jgi:hypothetical protein